MFPTIFLLNCDMYHYFKCIFSEKKRRKVTDNERYLILLVDNIRERATVHNNFKCKTYIYQPVDFVEHFSYRKRHVSSDKLNIELNGICYYFKKKLKCQLK